MIYNSLSKSAARAFLTLAALILMQSTPAKADCFAEVGPNPLPIFSVDYFDGPYLVGIQAGAGVQTAVTQVPNCPQLTFGTATTAPLALLSVSAPIQQAEFFISQYLWGDTGALVYWPFYPYVAGGAVTVSGIDLTSGIPYQATGAVVLTIFQQII